MPQSAAIAGVVRNWANLTAAARCSGLAFLKTYRLPPPVGDPPRLCLGRGATPKANLALVLTLVRLPVVVHIIAIFFSKKSLGVVPHSVMPAGITFSLRPRSTRNWAASATAGLSK